MSIEKLESKFYRLNQTLGQICQNLQENQNEHIALNHIEKQSQDDSVFQKVNASRSILLDKLVIHRNHILANSNNSSDFSRMKFNQYSFDVSLVDPFFIGNIKVNFEFSCFQKFKYMNLLPVRFIQLNDIFANKDLYDQFLLNERRLLIFSKLENKLLILQLDKDKKKQIILNTVSIDKRYWCKFDAYNNRIIVRCTDEISDSVHSRLNLYDENLNIIQTVKIEEKINSRISFINKNECCYWSVKKQKYIVIDLLSLNSKFSFGENETKHVNDGPLEFISSQRIYIRNETRRNDNKREILIISRSNCELVNSVLCDSMNIYVKVDDSSRLFINCYQQGSANKIECFDLNGNLLFRNVLNFFQMYQIDFSYFYFSNESLISLFNYDRKKIIFL